MPILTELRRRFATDIDTEVTGNCEEVLVTDARSGLRPNQLCNQKLSSALRREIGFDRWSAAASASRPR